MTRRIVSAFVPLVLALSLAPPAQARLRLEWAHHAGRDLVAVQVDADGSSVAAGRWDATGFGFGMLVVRYGPGGGKEWARHWRPSSNQNAFASATDVAIGPGGRIYVAGWAHPRHCGEGIVWFLRAYSPNGRFLWMRSAHDWRHCSGASSGTGVGVGGGLIAVSGLQQGCCDDPYHEGWVRAFGMNGRRLWTNRFEPGWNYQTWDLARDVAVGKLGSVYAVGSVDVRADDGRGPAPDREAMIQKISATGSTLWTRVLQQAGDRNTDEAQAVDVRGDALVVAARLNGGEAWSAFGQRGHTWLARYDVGGSLVWSKDWGKRQRRAETPSDVQLGTDGTIAVTGTRYVKAKRGTDAVTRTFAPHGRAIQVLRRHGQARWILSGGGAPWRGTLTITFGTSDGKYPSARHGTIQRWA